MKRLILLALLAASCLPAAQARRFHGGTPTGGGASLVFDYPNFQTYTGININGSTIGDSPDYALILNNAEHSSNAAWYETQQSVSSFTTDFTFSLSATGEGIGFVAQNSTSASQMPCTAMYPTSWGTGVAADANGAGYGAYYQDPLVQQCAVSNSVSIQFDVSGQNVGSYLGTSNPSTLGLYAEGGPWMGVVAGSPPFTVGAGFVPSEDLTPYSINLGSADTMSAHLVYDGSYYTLTLKDTSTGAQVRKVWPVSVSTFTGSTAYVGFVGGTVNPVVQQVLSWDFYSGYNTRLSTPTFTVTPGMYSSAQTVGVNCPSGATCYYTTDGTLPTTSSTQYTTALTVSASQVVSAVAVESNFTDSNVAQGNYIISGGGNTINFPSGFAGTSLIKYNGTAKLSSSAIQLTDTANMNETGSAWYAVPVNVAGFTTTFTLNLTSASANGMCFAIQNPVPIGSEVAGDQYTSGVTLALGGGINALGYSQDGLGFQGFYNGVCVKFDIYGSDTTGVYSGPGQPGQNGGTSLSPVTLGSHNPLTVTITYNNSTTTLTVAVEDSASNMFSHSYTVDIPALVGGNTAYVGFTGGTGGEAAIQQVSSWTM